MQTLSRGEYTSATSRIEGQQTAGRRSGEPDPSDRRDHSPAYAAKLGNRWHIVVPVRGKLAPRICAETFSMKVDAEHWLASTDGQHAVASMRAPGLARTPTHKLASRFSQPPV
jgi:hypothetical protein